MLAPPSRKELVEKVYNILKEIHSNKIMCCENEIQVITRDPKLPSRLRAVRELNRRLRASEIVFNVVLPWYRKFQQRKRIQEALQKAMRKQISDNYNVKDGFEYDV